VHDRHYGEDHDGNRCIRVRHHVPPCSRYVGAFKSRATIELRSAITANAIRAGVTATRAAQKIPGYESLEQGAERRNPSGRLTTPDDVARALVVLSHPDTAWITGNVIGVDGGEDVVM